MHCNTLIIYNKNRMRRGSADSSEFAVQRQERKEFDLQSLSLAPCRLPVVADGLAALLGFPNEMALVAQLDRVCIFRLHHALEPQRRLLREFGAVDDQANLRIQPLRSLIEIHRPHEHLAAIEEEYLRMQRVLAVARYAFGLPAAVRTAEESARLVQFNSLVQE